MALPQIPSKPIIENNFPLSVGIALNLCTSRPLKTTGHRHLWNFIFCELCYHDSYDCTCCLPNLKGFGTVH